MQSEDLALLERAAREFGDFKVSEDGKEVETLFGTLSLSVPNKRLSLKRDGRVLLSVYNGRLDVVQMARAIKRRLAVLQSIAEDEDWWWDRRAGVRIENGRVHVRLQTPRGQWVSYQVLPTGRIVNAGKEKETEL
ncbi:MAG: hypothetical protein QXI02_04075 [Candidatus Caldarchaeum sp.]